MPPGIPELAFFKPDQWLDPAVIVPQVGGKNCLGTLIEGRFWVGPLLATMEELEAVIVEATSKCQSSGKIACSQDSECFWARDFVNIRDNDNVSVIGLLLALERREDLFKHGVSLQVLGVPCSRWVPVFWVLKLMVDELLPIWLKLIPVVLDDQRFGMVGEGFASLHDHKVVNIVVCGV